MRRMWLRWRRNCMALSVVVVMGLTGSMVTSGQASGVVVSHPPKALLINHLPPKVNSPEARATDELPNLRALFALPLPAPQPVLALTPSVPIATGMPAPAATAAASSPTPVPAVPATTQVPPIGHATAYGCAAAMAYLKAYAAPDFIIACVIDPYAHQATTTCISGYSPCSLGRFILISDPCPAAYMNEASNSLVLMGLSDAHLDPYGSCG